MQWIAIEGVYDKFGSQQHKRASGERMIGDLQISCRLFFFVVKKCQGYFQFVIEKAESKTLSRESEKLMPSESRNKEEGKREYLKDMPEKLQETQQACKQIQKTNNIFTRLQVPVSYYCILLTYSTWSNCFSSQTCADIMVLSKIICILLVVSETAAFSSLMKRDVSMSMNLRMRMKRDDHLLPASASEEGMDRAAACSSRKHFLKSVLISNIFLSTCAASSPAGAVERAVGAYEKSCREEGNCLEKFDIDGAVGWNWGGRDRCDAT